MKPYTLLLTLLLFTGLGHLSAQQRLTVRELGGGYVFSLDNEILTPREVIRLLPRGSEERRLLSSSGFYSITGLFFSAFGGGLAGVALADALLGGEMEPQDRWTVLGIAAVSIGISIPLTLTAKRRTERAVYLINQGERIGSYRPQLRLGASGSGVGLVMRF
jgi:hypothetical protein